MRPSVAVLAIALPQVVSAQQIVVVEWDVNLRRDPSTNQTPIMLLLPPEELELLDSVKTNNFYNVFRAESADTGWVWERINDWLDTSSPVRISGWLLFDPSHRNHLGRYRKTLWEIHPITRIEVWHNGVWST